MRQQFTLDLPQFNPETPYFDLLIDTAQEFDVTVREPPDPVAGTVERSKGAGCPG